MTSQETSADFSVFRLTLVRVIAVAAGMLLLMTMGLGVMGRRSWCACGSWDPTSWDIWSSHNSQHLVDPYFFSHMLHGVLFFWFLQTFAGRFNENTRLLLAIAIEVGWELLENSPLIINRYRESTMALNYLGDSIANSWFDVIACLLGYTIAARSRWLSSMLLFVTVEFAMLYTIRDCLTLNVLMLVWPIDWIKQWQTPIGM
jgi:hypothetical protein